MQSYPLTGSLGLVTPEMLARRKRSKDRNCQVYDSSEYRFLSPDKYVQGADFTQGYNRYSYVQNNPMNRTDPSGWKMVPNRGPWVNYNGMYARSAYFTMHFRPFLYDVTIGPESGMDDYNDGGATGGEGYRGRGWYTTGLCGNGLKNYIQHLRDVEEASKPRKNKKDDNKYYSLDESIQIIFDACFKNSLEASTDKGAVSFGEKIAAFILRYAINLNGLPNPFFMAEAIFSDFGFEGDGLEKDGGAFFILVGSQTGQIFPYSEFATGMSNDIGFGFEVGRVDATGNSSDFNSNYFYGMRDKVWVAAGPEFYSAGAGFAWSSYNHEKVYCTSAQIGIGAAAPLIPPFSGGYNQGEIKSWKW
jgi:RHS repeat-associated protein